jgi:hypothetical protein
MNKLCISKLLQVIEQDLIPTERNAGAPSRPKPAPQPVATTTPFASASPSPQPMFKSASGF